MGGRVAQSHVDGVFQRQNRPPGGRRLQRTDLRRAVDVQDVDQSEVACGHAVARLYQGKLPVGDVRLALQDLPRRHLARLDQRPVDLALLPGPLQRGLADLELSPRPHQVPPCADRGSHHSGDRFTEREHVDLVGQPGQLERSGIDRHFPKPFSNGCEKAQGCGARRVVLPRKRLRPAQRELAPCRHPKPRIHRDIGRPVLLLLHARCRPDRRRRPIAVPGHVQRELLQRTGEARVDQASVVLQREPDRVVQ